uniref:Transposase n=1 Tax=Hydatigena taeniaeformis TaxID=6205 RepID=A0A0R3XCT9_HYDTA
LSAATRLAVPRSEQHWPDCLRCGGRLAGCNPPPPMRSPTRVNFIIHDAFASYEVGEIAFNPKGCK